MVDRRLFFSTYYSYFIREVDLMGTPVHTTFPLANQRL